MRSLNHRSYYSGMLNPRGRSTVEWPPDQQPLLVVIVDMEAEFDWSIKSSRKARGVRSASEQWRAQKIYKRYGIRPTYVLDYPVSSRPEGFTPIRDFVEAGHAEIGAHLQPWDTPPMLEDLSDKNSYPGNLPPELERAKLTELTEMVHRNLGARPRIYKAGRYGVGPATTGILEELGYEVDVSVLPGTNLSRHQGPDFRRCGGRPYWFGPDEALLEVPLSIGFTGSFARLGVGIYQIISRPILERLHVPGMMARLRLLERITLTPEGVTFAEQRRLTEALIDRGHRVFSLTYHSPSLLPGNTPYVRTQASLEAFLDRIEQYVEFFINEIGGAPATPLEVKQLAENQRQRHSTSSNTGGSRNREPRATKRTVP